MDDSKKTERCIPCLMNRLCYSQTAQDNKADANIQRLKQDIRSNILGIMSSRFRASEEELRKSPEIIASVLGYGLRDFCGRSHSVSLQNQLRNEIFQQIRQFEPRIDPESLDIVLIDDGSQKTVIEMEIHGKICVAQ